jgi:Oxidoreductase FAD-binding domain
VAGTAVLGRLSWQLADVTDVVVETPRVKTIVFDVPGWPGHRAGQHVDVRLTAEDGYQAERSYSIASAPNGSRIELTVERLDNGEVSPYLTDELRPGDQIELRGPMGGYSCWCTHPRVSRWQPSFRSLRASCGPVRARNMRRVAVPCGTSANADENCDKAGNPPPERVSA